LSSPEPGDWPDGVKPVGVGDLRRLGIDDRNQLFWDGRRIEIRRPLVLTGPQKIVTGVVTVCAVLGALGGFVSGINNAAVFLCARDVHWLSCPPQSTPLQPTGSARPAAAPARP
jgi:hypothetical protein